MRLEKQKSDRMVRLRVCDVVLEARRFELPSQLNVLCQGSVVGQVKYERGIVKRETGREKMEDVSVPPFGGDYDWSAGLRCIEKYLNPLNRSAAAVYSGSSIEFCVDSDVFVDVYVLAGAIGLAQLQLSMELAIYGYGFDVLVELYHCVMMWVRRGMRIVPRVHQCLILLLSRDVTTDRFEMLEHLEFAEVVFKIMNDRKDLYPLVVLWLSNVYGEYYASEIKSVYSLELSEMLKMVRVENCETAFTRWIYCEFFHCDLGSIEPYASGFQFTKPWNLSANQAKWLIEKTGRLECHGKPVCDIDSFSMEEIESLIPYLSSYSDICDQIAKRLIDSGEKLENCLVLKKMARYLSLEVLMSLVMDEEVSVVISYMVKWYKSHGDAANYDPIFLYFDKEPDNPCNGYYLLKLLKSRSELGQRVCDALNTTSFVCAVFEWMISNVKLFAMTDSALECICERFHFEGLEMKTFVRFLSHFEIYTFKDQYIMPVCKESYWITVELVTRSSRTCSEELMRQICEAVANDFYSLSCSQVRFLAKFVKFNELAAFNVNRCYNEDGFFYLASISDEPNWDMISYNCLSVRMAAKFILTENWKFQFSDDPESFCHNIDFAKCQFDEDKWGTPGPICSIDGPIAVLDLSESFDASAYDMRWIDCADIQLNTKLENCLSARVIVINQTSEGTDVKTLIETASAHAHTVLVNAKVVRAASDWDLLKLFDFADDDIDAIDWETPPSDFPVAKENLQVFDIESGDDTYFQSIPCKVNDVSNIATTLQMASTGRLFAAKFAGTNIRVFNFDLRFVREASFTGIACQRLKMQTLSWLCQ